MHWDNDHDNLMAAVFCWIVSVMAILLLIIS